MNVYTFYSPIDGWNSDKKLLDLWVVNWKNKGFNPVVLSIDDAIANPTYNNFVKKISIAYEHIMKRKIIHSNNPWNYYIFNNYVRFLAYADLNINHAILVMDYDMYNIDYTTEMNSNLSNNIVFQLENCPCIVSGTPENFQNMCNMISTASYKYYDILEEAFHQSKYSTFHEMAFMNCLRISQNPILINLLQQNQIIFTPAHKSIATNHLFHASNGILKTHVLKNPKLTHDDKIDLRIQIAKNKINNK